MELLIRKTDRQTQAARLAGKDEKDNRSNHVGDVVCIKPDGWPWSALERQNFYIIIVPDLPSWAVEALHERSIDRPRKIHIKNPEQQHGQTVPFASLNMHDKDKPGRPSQAEFEARKSARLAGLNI